MVNRLSRWAPLAGVAYTVLFAVVLFATPTTPDINDSTTKIIDFYSSHRGGMQLQVYVLAYCGVSVVVFFGVLTSYLRQHGANVLTWVGFAGSVILAAAFGVGASMTSMLTHKSVTMSPSTAQTLNLINNDVPFIMLFVGLLLTMIATGLAIVSTHALPTWMGWVAIVSGVGAGAGGWASWIALMLAGLWILAASVMLYRRMAASAASITLPETAADIPMQTQPTDAPTKIRS